MKNNKKYQKKTTTMNWQRDFYEIIMNRYNDEINELELAKIIEIITKKEVSANEFLDVFEIYNTNLNIKYTNEDNTKKVYIYDNDGEALIFSYKNNNIYIEYTSDDDEEIVEESKKCKVVADWRNKYTLIIFNDYNSLNVFEQKIIFNIINPNNADRIKFENDSKKYAKEFLEVFKIFDENINMKYMMKGGINQLFIYYDGNEEDGIFFSFVNNNLNIEMHGRNVDKSKKIYNIV